MKKQTTFQQEAHELIMKSYKEALSDNIKRGIRRAKERKEKQLLHVNKSKVS